MAKVKAKSQKKAVKAKPSAKKGPAKPKAPVGKASKPAAKGKAVKKAPAKPAPKKVVPKLVSSSAKASAIKGKKAPNKARAAVRVKMSSSRNGGKAAPAKQAAPSKQQPKASPVKAVPVAKSAPVAKVDPPTKPATVAPSAALAKPAAPAPATKPTAEKPVALPTPRKEAATAEKSTPKAATKEAKPKAPVVAVMTGLDPLGAPAKTLKRAMKERFSVEFYMNATPGSLYDMLSTPSGLSEWFCEDVDVRGDQFTFRWGNDAQSAQCLSRKFGELMRFQWDDDEDQGSYFELRIRVDTMTNETCLVVTDHAWPKDMDEAKALWGSQIHALQRVLGA